MTQYIEQQPEYWIVKGERGEGNALVLRTAWSNRFLPIWTQHGATGLRLNAALGWNEDDLSFVSALPGLTSLDVVSDNVKDVTPVFRLANLKSLGLFCKAQTSGDFAVLTNLRHVGLDWRKAYTSIFQQDKLVTITILHYPYQDLLVWKTTLSLRELKLSSTTLKSLIGLDRFSNLKNLDLYRCRNLSSVASLCVVPRLRGLQLAQCKSIADLSPVGALGELRELLIEDCGQIQSVKPIAECRNLESLQIAGDTVVQDGDLSGLQNLQCLRRVLIAHRKHYSHRDYELQKSLH